MMVSDASTHENSDNLSDIEDEESKQISKDAEKNSISNDFKEKIKNFIYYDDLIRKKTEEIKELKIKKKPCEDYIIHFFETSESSFIDLQSKGKLTKNESETKAPLKIETIKEAISEKSKNEKIFDTEDKYNQFIESIMELMDKKRPVKKRINVKRTFKREKK